MNSIGHAVLDHAITGERRGDDSGGVTLAAVGLVNPNDGQGGCRWEPPIIEPLGLDQAALWR